MAPLPSPSPSPAPFPSPASDGCIMYLVRHGATANNLADPPRLQGRHLTADLSVRGRSEADAAARLFPEGSIHHVYSSPLHRAVQTAEIIGAPHGLVPETVDALIEVDVGDWEGRDWDQIQRSEPEAYERFLANPAIHPYTGGESLQQVSGRVLPAMLQLLKQNLGNAIVVVAHNVVNRVYVASLLNIPLAKARAIPQHNGGVNIIRYRKGLERLTTLNAVHHLREVQ